MIKIILLGAGNVGLHLYQKFSKCSKVEIIQWYNRSLSPIKSFEQDVTITNDIKNLKAADIYILALSDNAISHIANELPSLKGIVVHTAGGVSINVLNKFEKHGVFYPLQSFSKNRVIDFKTLPFCIEGNSEETEQTLIQFAMIISESIHRVNSSQRLALHTAAVFINNFTNHLYQVGATICEEHKVSFELLQPLIKETGMKVQTISPKDAQTGPAIRKDYTTIKKHVELLSNPIFKNLYLTITESIQKNKEYSEL